tara:strand:- start:689 stop:1030 length:342 start_codon:yes stop_codon:yes gene_type:complete
MLALNITSAQYSIFRYAIWITSTTIKIFYTPGPIIIKIHIILSSLARDYRFQIFEFFGQYLSPLSNFIQPLKGIIYKLLFLKENLHKPMNKGLFLIVNSLSNGNNAVENPNLF